MDSFSKFYNDQTLVEEGIGDVLLHKIKKLIEYHKHHDEKYLKHYREMSDLAKSMGYRIVENDYSYHRYKGRVIGIADDDFLRSSTRLNPTLRRKTIRRWFTLAHEMGHALQWEKGGYAFQHEGFNFFREFAKLEIANDEDGYIELNNLFLIWKELDAWIRAMEFIPKEYLKDFKKYAKVAYMSYIRTNPEYQKNKKYFDTNMIIRNKLYKLEPRDLSGI